jgi:hypothetical protein
MIIGAQGSKQPRGEWYKRKDGFETWWKELTEDGG